MQINQSSNIHFSCANTAWAILNALDQDFFNINWESFTPDAHKKHLNRFLSNYNQILLKASDNKDLLDEFENVLVNAFISKIRCLELLDSSALFNQENVEEDLSELLLKFPTNVDLLFFELGLKHQTKYSKIDFLKNAAKRNAYEKIETLVGEENFYEYIISNPFASVDFLTLLENSKKWQLAIKFANKIIAASSQSIPNIYKKRAGFYFKIYEWQLALQDMSIYLEQTSLDEVERIKCLNFKAKCLFELNCHPEENAIYQEIFKNYAKSNVLLTTYHNQAYYFMALKDWPSVERVCSSILDSHNLDTNLEIEMLMIRAFAYANTFNPIGAEDDYHSVFKLLTSAKILNEVKIKCLFIFGNDEQKIKQTFNHLLLFHLLQCKLNKTDEFNINWDDISQTFFRCQHGIDKPLLEEFILQKLFLLNNYHDSLPKSLVKNLHAQLDQEMRTKKITGPYLLKQLNKLAKKDHEVLFYKRLQMTTLFSQSISQRSPVAPDMQFIHATY